MIVFCHNTTEKVGIACDFGYKNGAESTFSIQKNKISVGKGDRKCGEDR
jgi:hypothetical protein